MFWEGKERQTDRQTERKTDGHHDFMAESTWGPCSENAFSLCTAQHLEGIGYCPSSLFTKTKGHVSIIKAKLVKTTGFNLKIPIGVLLHHLL